MFAAVAPAAGVEVDFCPALVLPARDTAALDRTGLADYVVAWDASRSAVAFGLASLVNHSPTPNVELLVRDRPDGPDVVVATLCPVAAGTELFADYGADHPVAT